MKYAVATIAAALAFMLLVLPAFVGWHSPLMSSNNPNVIAPYAEITLGMPIETFKLVANIWGEPEIDPMPDDGYWSRTTWLMKELTEYYFTANPTVNFFREGFEAVADIVKGWFE